MQLGLRVELLGIGRPIRDLARNRIILGLDVLVERYHAFGATTAQLHERLVDRDSHQPSVELRLTLELSQVLIGLQERILHHVFRVFPVLPNVLRDAEYVPAVALNQFFKRRDLSALGCLYQRQFITDGLAQLWCDGTNYSVDSTIFGL